MKLEDDVIRDQHICLVEQVCAGSGLYRHSARSACLRYTCEPDGKITFRCTVLLCSADFAEDNIPMPL